MIRSAKILCLLLLISSCLSASDEEKENNTKSSLLKSGKWFKAAIIKDGVYRIDFSKLRQIGLEDPSNPRIFSNNNGQLSYYNNSPSPDDLHEIAISVIRGEDQIFNEGDYILFYGKGTGRWNYDKESGYYYHKRHNYSDTAFYFITSGAEGGKKIEDYTQPASDPDYMSQVSDALYIHELETENIIKSGREWYQPVSAVKGTLIDPGFSDLVISEPVKYSFRVLARSPVPALFRLLDGSEIIKSILIPGVNISSISGTYAQHAETSGTITPATISPVFEMKFFNNGESSALGWIDFVILQGRRINKFNGITTHFTDSRSAAGGTVTAFSIDYSGEGGIIWDVTDPVNVKNIRYSKEGGKISYKTHTDTLRTFVAFRPENAGTPFIRSVSIPNQDLHASKPADMIIVTHPLFRKHALKLADIHNTHSGLESLIVTTEEIYNEFSGGITDITAIRNFVRMKYKNQNGTDQSLRYLLLFGDGSYDNKTPAPGNPNYIPTYQSQNSNVLISSFTSDDFYGLLGDDEGEDTGTIDVGIGRLPVSDTTGAGIIVSKIAGYLDPSNTGDWKNVICITADDEDGNTHMNDAEGIASIISDSIPWANVSKIYFDAFKQVTSSNGQFYPDVTKAINNQINSGALIFNYIGHGNELSLGHERVLTSEDINSWKNRSKMPLFITATCEFSRFDDIDFNIITREITNKVSAGEKVLLKKDGGAIAIMSTTRLAYSASNYVLNRNIFDVAFDRNNKDEKPRLGDIIRLAKNSSGSSLNKRNFVLLGDPALELAFPSEGKVVTDSINKVSVNALTDTLKALSIITVAGHIEDLNGNLAEDFNGVVEPLIFGKESQIRTLANDGGTKMDFGSFNEIIFRGKTKASGGRFRFTFIVPRDIDFRYGRGRISYYAYDGTREMNGSYNRIIVGGFNEITVHDTTGPLIKLYLNDTLFRPGGMTDLNPVLLAIIEDKDGINTSGNGIGHDLAGWLDNDRDNAFVLNNHFENDFGSYTRGRVIYNLPSITPGNHKLTMKAWDNFNNSTEESIIFVAVTGGYFILNNIINYPNPFLSDTKITAEHNRPDEELRIIINIYSINGKLIRSIETRERSSGYQMSPVMWDGKDSGGNRVGKGTFPYKIQISTVSGETAVSTGKMIIL